MGYGFIAAGLVFLFNPCINIIDILPDFIGYALIICGLTKSALLIDKLDYARSVFIKLFFVGLAKFVSIAFIVMTDDTMILVLTFSFAVIELIYLIPAFIYLVDGFVYSGTRCGGSAVLKGADRFKRASVTFFIVRAACAVLPELTSLSMYDNIGYVTAFSVNIANYKPAFVVIGCVIALVFGIAWLVRGERYVARIRADKPYVERISEHYELEIAPNEQLFIRRRMSFVLVMFVAAAIFGADIYLDGLNYLPDFVSAAFLVAVSALMLKYHRFAKTALAGSIAATACSAAAWVVSLIYFNDFTIGDTRYVAEAYDRYRVVMAALSVSDFIYAAAFILVLYCLVKIAPEHIEKLYGINIHDRMKVDAYMRDTLATISSKVNVCFTLTVMSAIAGAVYAVLIPEYGQVWILDILISIAWIISVYSLTKSLESEIYTDR